MCKKFLHNWKGGSDDNRRTKKQLAKQGEGYTLEFKENQGITETIAKSISKAKKSKVE